MNDSEKNDIAKQLCQALAYLHAMNIIHQDMKPANVLVYDIKIELCDFGFSRVKSLNDATKTHCHELPGTVMFMSPEMILTKKVYLASDIWALVCTILSFLR